MYINYYHTILSPLLYIITIKYFENLCIMQILIRFFFMDYEKNPSQWGKVRHQAVQHFFYLKLVYWYSAGGGFLLKDISYIFLLMYFYGVKICASIMAQPKRCDIFYYVGVQS